jgi:hypothetical protein
MKTRPIDHVIAIPYSNPRKKSSLQYSAGISNIKLRYEDVFRTAVGKFKPSEIIGFGDRCTQAYGILNTLLLA